MEFQSSAQKFDSRGLDLNNPVDHQPDGFFPFLKNVRGYAQGTFQPRVGVQRINSVILPTFNVHSMGRLNDYVVNEFARFLGSDSELYYGYTGFTNIEGGWDGQPLSFVPFRPEQTNRTWMYIANAAKMRKVNTDGGTPKLMGVVPPRDIPVATLLPPKYFVPGAFTNASGWTNHGTAGSVGGGARLTTVTIGDILYDNTVLKTGWADIRPTGGNLQNITVGMRLIVGSGGGAEIVTVEEVHNAYDSGANLIDQIQYDDDINKTGLCTIITTAAIAGLRRNTMFRFGDGEYVNIISVSDGPGGISSFRCATVTTKAAGSACNAALNGNVRVYLTGTHAAGEVLLGLTMTSTVTKGVGTMAFNAGGSTYYNMKVVQGRPITADDYIHLSVLIDKPDLLIEGKLVLGVDAASTSGWNENDSTRNAYVKSFRPNDFQDTVQNLATSDTARTKALQLQQTDNTSIQLDTTLNPDTVFGVGGSSSPADVASVSESQPPINPEVSSSGQMILGESQWCEFRWRVADLIRLGAQQSRDLGQVKAIQVVFNCSDTIVVQIADLWIGGTYGPDTGPNLTPMIYRARYRSSETGAHSLPGPAMRSGMQTLRQGVFLTCTGSTDPQVDKIDWERLGGQNTEWHYVGTVDNDDTDPVEFTDDQLSAAVVTNPALDTKCYLPFPVIGSPSAHNVLMIGTAIKGAPGEFQTNWAKGTVVKINGRVTSLYAAPDSDELLHLADSVGSGAALMEISEPVFQGTPLPVMWGPYYNTMFACGAATDAGALYFTNANNPDGAADSNRIEVTSPTEKLMNGCTFDTKAFVFSDARMFQLNPAPNTARKFDWTEVPNGKGLYSRWAITVGPRIWFLSSDGIYETAGGEPVKISDAIAPLFPQGDKDGYAVNGIYPVKMVRNDAGGQGMYLRLSYYQGFVYFDYRDINDAPHTMVYEVATKAWYFDEYFNNTNPKKGITCRLQETWEDGADDFKHMLIGFNFGYVGTPSGTDDDTLSINCGVWTPAKEMADPRAKKLYGDCVIGVDPQNAAISVEGFINNFLTSVGTLSVTGGGRIVSNPLELSAGGGVFGQNFGLKITWTSSGTPVLYFWEPSFLARPEDTFLRGEDWTDGGYPGAKLVRGFILEANSYGNSKGVAFQGDQNTLQSYTMNHPGQTLKAYAVSPPQIASLLRLLPTESVAWQDFRVSYIYDKYPENAAIPTAFDDCGEMGAKFVQGLLMEALGTDPAMKVLRDGSVHERTLNVSQTGSTLSIVPYSFETPFIAHSMALRPTTAIRIGRVNWIYEPAPESALYWVTQGTDNGVPGWQFLKDCYFPYISNDQVELIIKVDGVSFTFRFPSSNGQYVKSYLVFSQATNGRMLKGKLFEYRAQAVVPLTRNPVPFRLFKKDMEVRTHGWNSKDFVVAKPFGGPSYRDGAKV